MKLENVLLHNDEQDELKIVTKKIKPKFGEMIVPTMTTPTLKLKAF
jgi:hypothetical protein